MLSNASSHAWSSTTSTPFFIRQETGLPDIFEIKHPLFYYIIYTARRPLSASQFLGGGISGIVFVLVGSNSIPFCHAMNSRNFLTYTKESLQRAHLHVVLPDRKSAKWLIILRLFTLDHPRSILRFYATPLSNQTILI